MTSLVRTAVVGMLAVPILAVAAVVVLGVAAARLAVEVFELAMVLACIVGDGVEAGVGRITGRAT